MSVQTVARRYATALADVVIQQGEAREVQQELLAWEELLQANANLREVFANPTIALDQKRAVLNKLIEMAKPRATTGNFLKVLLQNQRLTELGEINRKFAQIMDDRGGMVAATVTTARAVPQDAQAKDRKSTRLNSSHRCNSYAVFCLKKKMNADGSKWRERVLCRGDRQ